MCIVFSIVGRVCWCSRVTISSMFVDGSSYVSFPRPFILCIHFMVSFVREWDEWLSLRGSRPLFLSSLHSLLMWLHFIFWFELIIIHLYIFIVSLSSSSLLLIHSFHFTPLLFSYTDLFQIWYFLCIILSISLLVRFSSLPHYCFYIHIGHP